MDIKECKSNGKWSVRSIRSKASTIENFASKISFLEEAIIAIRNDLGIGRETISGSSALVIRKLHSHIHQLNKARKENGSLLSMNERLNWSGDPDTLIYIFYKLKNNTLGDNDTPLLDESNRKLAEFIKNNFSINLSIETIFNKLKSFKTNLESGISDNIGIEIIFSNEKKI
ncbi:MAG: hypothetical protein NVV82_00385 [Sporocytophaga sp.]|nr:hypothetical protein [Sporocytophaga sp.]